MIDEEKWIGEVKFLLEKCDQDSNFAWGFSLGYKEACQKRQDEIPVKCADCSVCRRCSGRGQVYERVSTWWDDNADEHPDICPNCKGSGKREAK